MRMFLPIRGPGGRYLTPREKAALLVLGLTLVLSVLTLLAGSNAYSASPAQNPVFAFVALLCRTFGGGIVALYGLVLVWSGLIYFKGEKVARVGPLPGRLFAALCVTAGISGALGIARLETAGGLGLTIGRALEHTFGAGLGFPVLILLMLLGFHLAGQGALNALREPAAAPGGTATLRPRGFASGMPHGRFTNAAPLPDDGDPTADERTLAVTQAVEEIERRRGVTIVEVEEDAERAASEEERLEEESVDERRSIGEEVDAVPEPEEGTEEGEIREGLAAVREALEPAGGKPEAEAEAPAGEEEEEEAAGEDENGEAEAAGSDPYAEGGLLRRLRERRPPSAAGGAPDPEPPYTSFDWRGRPLE